MQVDRGAFYRPEEIAKDVDEKFEKATDKSEPVEYITFVPDGEPTLDINLGGEIELLKPLGIKIAVITNASLMWCDEVRNNLLKADWVSLKIDAVTDEIWHKINRPHKSLKLETILEGMLEFTDLFKGELATETMLIQDINDYDEEIGEIADFLVELKPDKAYIAIPTRPPAEKWAKPAKEGVINMAFQVFAEKLGAERVEYLIGYEGNAFAFTGNIIRDLLSITAVHPMRKEAVEEFLKKADADWQTIEKLLGEGRLVELEYKGNTYYTRRFTGS